MQGVWVWSLVRGLRSHTTLRPKNQNLKQKQYCNKFNKDFKKWSTSKKSWKNKVMNLVNDSVQFSCLVVADSATPWIAALQASLSITSSQSLLELMPNESVMPSNHLILCHSLLLLPPIPPSIRVFSNESTLHMRWPKYWSLSFGISPSKEHSGLITFKWTGWISLQSKGLSRVFSNITVQTHQFFSAQLSSQSSSHIHTWPLEKP